MLKEIILKNRSYRRFHQEIPVGEETLRGLIELARLSPSAANLQPLKYILSSLPAKNGAIFEHLAWAGYLKEWDGPAEGERPAAYIIILGDTTITKNFGCDHGIAAQSIMLGAAEKGLGGCIIASIKKDNLREALKIPARYETLLVLAIGKPTERVLLEPVGPSGDIRYYRDKDAAHHVPKRPMEELILDI